MRAKAIIFDMDGVIIDSEPFWQQAQISALADYGAAVSVTECETLTKGKRLDEIARVWCEKFNLMNESSQLELKILAKITALISTNGEPMLGIYEALEYFHQQGYRLALATSSSHQVIGAVFHKLQLWHYFEVISSAEDEAHGKPHPAVYLSTARKLDLSVDECLVIEDSLNGFQAAQAAGMKTLVVADDCAHVKFSNATGRYRSMPILLQALMVPTALPHEPTV
ncbi:HAD family hydrolase [Aeromonas caviae]|uniref:HAD family hydrolase n=1 Tax=Aeromonas TaxID=642 RepID=UPI0006A60035|nr:MULTISPECIES: HAD-IA family hydrolase [Aeromonas]KOG93938.1 HAD family hydrolase [Aeromonas caviae]